jgi:tetratricopeptide (TPR) repeat protein
LIKIGNSEKALKTGFRALEITEARLGPDDPNVSSILVRLGRVHMRDAKYKEAKAYFKRALTIVQNKLGPEHHYAGDNVSIFPLSSRSLLTFPFFLFPIMRLGRAHASKAQFIRTPTYMQNKLALSTLTQEITDLFPYLLSLYLHFHLNLRWSNIRSREKS